MQLNKLISCLAFLIISPSYADVIISEYLEGSGNNKAIEFFNSSSTAVNLNTYTLEIFPNGSTESSVKILLNGTLPAKGVYVIVNPNADNNILEQADQTAQVYINGNDAIVLNNGDTVIDSMGQVGVDEYWESEGISMSNQTLRRRAGFDDGDTDPNDEFFPHVNFISFATDDYFDLGTHNGFGEGTPGTPPSEPTPLPDFGQCDDPATLISEIQGPTTTSPLNYEYVVIEGIVTSVHQKGSESLGGFFIQEEDSHRDGNANTSEGVFVSYTTLDVGSGNKVRLRGLVHETNSLTQIADVSEIIFCEGNLSVTPVSTSMPFGGLGSLEALEGMLIELSHPVVAINTDRLHDAGEFAVAKERFFWRTQLEAPVPAEEIDMRLHSLLIDDGSRASPPLDVAFPTGGLSAQNTLRLGTEITNPRGVLNYQNDEFRLIAASDLQFLETNPRLEQPENAEEGDLRIASFNIGPFLNTHFYSGVGADSELEYERQLEKLVAAISSLNADIIGLGGIQANGFGERSAISELTQAVSDYSSLEWEFVEFANFGNSEDVRTANSIIYRSDRVIPTGVAAQGSEEYSSLIYEMMAQSFKDKTNEDEITVVVSELVNRVDYCTGSYTEVGDDDSGDGQQCGNTSRLKAVEQMLQWLGTSPTGQADDDVVLLGTFNAYSMEDPIQALLDAGFIDLQMQELGAENYTIARNGFSGVIDYVFATESLSAKVVSTSTWHINADEPRALDYNIDNKGWGDLMTRYFNADPYRSAEHDPVLIAINTVSSDDGGGDGDTPPPSGGGGTPTAPQSSSGGSFPWPLCLVALYLVVVRRLSA